MKVLESRTGHTGHNINPWFAVDNGDADEAHGRVWFGALAWSGNWRISVEQTPYRQVRVTGGFNPFDFAYQLKPGESLETPVFYAGYSAARIRRSFALAAHSRAHRDRARRHQSAAAAGSLQLVGSDGIQCRRSGARTALAEKAAKLGVELFVMDDGWFGKRNNDHAGLGDWTVNPEKFPNGLNGLISNVNALGMDFGLWVEPEMVNPDSDLYRAHPDWVMNFPGRPRSELRNQLILNMARDDVESTFSACWTSLRATYNIRYFKWDMNRIFAEPGWPEAPIDKQRNCG